MKKILLFVAAIAILAACSKEIPNESPLDKYNGYDQFLKVGEIEKDLRIRGGVIGTVIYGLELEEDDPYFYVTYEIDPELDWEIVKTHMYAGRWKFKPRSRRNDPRRLRFPNKTTHNPAVNTYTYTIPIGDLPPYNDPGFVVAAHALVYNPNKCGDGQYRHAWADWDKRFRCRGWGGYTNYYYNAPADPQITVYASYYTPDDGGTLNLDLINKTAGETDNQVKATGVGTPPSELYHGATVDVNTKNLYYVDYSGTDPVLMINNLEEDPESDDYIGPYSAGTLDETPQSVSFNDGVLYYVSETPDGDFDLNKVTFTEPDETTGQVSIASQAVFSSVPNTVVAVNDIAFDPDGQSVYMVGNFDADGDDIDEVILIEADVSDPSSDNHVYYVTPVTYANGDNIDFTTNPQIDYGDDGDLYLIDASIAGGGIAGALTPQTGVMVITDDNDVIDPIEPFGASGFGEN
jgi:hypothetical protein